MSRLRVVIALAGLALALAAVPALAAGGGALTPQGCIDDNDTGADACAQSTDGLDEAQSVAVSPDGNSVYVASQVDDAIVRFDRDPATGALTPQGCVDDNDVPEGPDGCALSTNGLNGVSSVTVSPDGESVYAASIFEDAVVWFERHPATGALNPQGCFEDNDGGPDGCTAANDGLDGAFGVTVSPDGESLYVASTFDDALARFDRDPATGALTGQGCVDDNDTGADTCGQTTDGLDGVLSLAVSPDGDSVYSAANGDDAIARFDRAPATGAITPQGCVDDNEGTVTQGFDACALSADGFDGVRGIAVSPDGRTVYGGSNSDDAIVVLDRNQSDGAIGPIGCIDDNEGTATQGPDTCAQSADGLDGAIGVAVTPDAESVYVAAPSDDAVVRFDRAPVGGSLTPRGCVDADAGADTCTQSADGLDGVIAVEGAPGGESVYTAANSDDALAVFAREPEDTEAPETQVDAGPSGLTNDSTPTFTFSADEPGSTFQCRLYPSGDPPPSFSACSGLGTHTPSALVDDVYVFEAQATDPEANADPTPASRTFTVDTAAPAAPSLQETHPASPANDNSPEIEGVAEEGSTVSLYANGTCAGSPVDTASAFELATTGVTVSVADNSQTSFSARTTDGASNVSPCSAPITYVEDSTVPTPPGPDPPAAPGDTSAPDTLITSGPKRVSKRANTAFRFDSTEPASTFQCKLDDAPFEPCTSPDEFKAAKGKHTFEVRATDAAGNTDPTPATQSWTVKKKKKK